MGHYKNMFEILSNRMSRQLYRVSLVAALVAFLSACSGEIPPHMRPLSKDAMHLLGEKGMSAQSAIFVRVFKKESELEVWKEREDGHYYHYKTYPICNWSGNLGPKQRTGDKQAPEGFYKVTKGRLNPKSKYHLAFNLGYPNKYDKAQRRSGKYLMIHGNCRSVGCYAMTDALVEEIYALAREAFSGGQQVIQVHAYPFRMTNANMRKHHRSKWKTFWHGLKKGYDHFEATRQPAEVAVCEKRYMVNVKFVGSPFNVDPKGPCPSYELRPQQIWAGASGTMVSDNRYIRAVGPKRRLQNGRLVAYSRPGGATGFGLLRVPTFGFASSSQASKSEANQSMQSALGFAED